MEIKESDIYLIDQRIDEAKKEKNLNLCMNLIEENLVNKNKFYGKKSPEFIKTAKQLCEVTNLLAIDLVENEKADEGLIFLEKAEKLFFNYKEVYNLCLNNLGCYYILTKNNEKSLYYFEKALILSIENGNKIYAAETYLNISTVYNKMNDYPNAVEMCLNCIITIQELLLTETLEDEKYTGVMNCLIISYRSLAVLYDNLNDTHNAVLYYKLSETLFSNFIKLQSSKNLLKNEKILPKIIESSYFKNLITSLLNDVDSVFKYNNIIGKEGKQFYIKFLNETLNKLKQENNDESNENNENEENEDSKEKSNVDDKSHNMKGV